MTKSFHILDSVHTTMMVSVRIETMTAVSEPLHNGHQQRPMAPIDFLSGPLGDSAILSRQI